ncbi:MAG: MarR family winged helix-turn-helix transcriptional regulator [Polymorphobacter sp.]
MQVDSTQAILDSPDGCHALRIRKLARRVTQLYDEALAPYGLTIGQMGILANLRRKRGIGIAGLAERLGSDASTLSRLLKPLANAGLISIEPDPDDRRAKLLHLTDAGADKKRTATVGWQAAQARIGDQLGTSRLSALRFILDDSLQNL